MQENVITYDKSFQTWEQELSTELSRTAESFVRIGYLLKVARDTAILFNSGYKNINDYAQAKFNIDKTQVSRFISIYDRFGEGGELKDNYKGFGYSKLAIMLQLPDGINEELTPDYTKNEINAVKAEINEEAKTSDIEAMIEEPDRRLEGMRPLEKIVFKIFEHNKNIYEKVYRIVKDMREGDIDDEEIEDAMTNDGTAAYFVRIPVEGRYYVTINAHIGHVKVYNTRTQDKLVYTSGALRQAVLKLLDHDVVLPDKITMWQQLTGRAWEEDIAPAQQVGRVTKAAVYGASRDVTENAGNASEDIGKDETHGEYAQDDEDKSDETPRRPDYIKTDIISNAYCIVEMLHKYNRMDRDEYVRLIEVSKKITRDLGQLAERIY